MAHLTDIFKYYGDQTTPRGVQEYIKRHINPNVKALKEAVDVKGQNASSVVMVGDVRDGKPGRHQKYTPTLHPTRFPCCYHHNLAHPFVAHSAILIALTEIYKHFGDQTTSGGVRAYFDRNVIPNAKALKAAIANGQNPTAVIMVENVRNGKPGKRETHAFAHSTLQVSFCYQAPHILTLPDIAKYYGSHSTKDGLYFYFYRNITPNVKTLKGAFDRGDDPKDCIMMSDVVGKNPGKGQTDIISSLLHISSYLLYFFMFHC